MNSGNRKYAFPFLLSFLRHKGLLIFLLLFILLTTIYYLDIVSLPELLSQPKYQWKPEYGELNGPDVSGRDFLVLQKLRSRFLHPPPVPHKGLSLYNLSSTSWGDDTSMGQSQIIRRIFRHIKKPGFFVECGALDGEIRSNTLYLERNLLWDGLLIEADPINFQELQSKRRRAWTSSTCLSTKSYPTMVSFEQKANLGKIANYGVGFVHEGYTDVQCFPFESYLLALNRTQVSYFSLDVEGSELDILKTIDFQKYDIKTLSVEFIHDKEGKDAIRNFMESQNYITLTEVTHPNWLANDLIFVKKSFFNEIPSATKDEFLGVDFDNNNLITNGNNDD